MKNRIAASLVPVKPSPEVKRLWKKICDEFDIAKTRVPLFKADAARYVKTDTIGRTLQRRVLLRSDEMEDMIVGIAKQLIDDYEKHKDNPEAKLEFDGMLYMMGWEVAGGFQPLYVGKTETLGSKYGILSANLTNVNKGQNKGKFARWGDNYQYHIGDLSACVLRGHKPKTKQKKYKRWAETLFTEQSMNTLKPRLKHDTFFWATPWKPLRTTIWQELGPTTLAVSEYLVIGVAGKISPKDFLNRDGVPRPLDR